MKIPDSNSGSGTKRCPKCTETKPATLEFFYKGAKWRDGFKPYCKECQKKHSKEWRAANPEKVKESVRQHRKANPELYKAYAKKSVAKRGDHIRAYRRKRWLKQRALPAYLLSKRMRTRLHKSLRMNKTGRPWEKILGYTKEELRLHIERQFERGMTWENMGDWQIDHIIPIASFRYDGEHDPEFKACWALTNLAPRWARDNQAKGAQRLLLL